MKDAPISDLLRQASIKTDNQLMAFSDLSWQDCPDNGKSTGAYIKFYQCGSIYHGKMFQDQLFTQFQKVSRMQHTYPEWL